MTEMKSRTTSFLKCERGTQMIEFAFLLPFLILFFAAIIEMGRMFYTYTTLNKATEVGARYLSSAPVTAGAYATADSNIAKNLVVCGKSSCTNETPVARNLAAANVTITPPGTSVGTRYVSVAVTYTYQPMIWNLSHLAGSGSLSLNFTFTPKITMRYMQ
jgi:Flp pilus assembly protein TadG